MLEVYPSGVMAPHPAHYDVCEQDGKWQYVRDAFRPHPQSL
jgi:hypothetical protein